MKGTEWIGLAQVAGPCKCKNEPSGCTERGKYRDWGWGPISFSRRTTLWSVWVSYL